MKLFNPLNHAREKLHLANTNDAISVKKNNAEEFFIVYANECLMAVFIFE